MGALALAHLQLEHQPAWPKQKAAEQLCASDVPGLDLFWCLAPLQP